MCRRRAEIQRDRPHIGPFRAYQLQPDESEQVERQQQHNPGGEEPVVPEERDHPAQRTPDGRQRAERRCSR